MAENVIATYNESTNNLKKDSGICAINYVIEPCEVDNPLTIKGNDDAVVIGSLTTTERDAISSPVDGSVIYNTTEDQFEFYQEDVWVPLQPFDYQYVESLNQIITNQEFTINPVTKFDESLTLEAGDYEIKLHFEADCNNIARSVEAGLYIDSTLVGQTFRKNPVVATDTFYVTKILRKTFTAGSHSFKLDFGLSGGGGAFAVSVANATLIVERKL